MASPSFGQAKDFRGHTMPCMTHACACAFQNELSAVIVYFMPTAHLCVGVVCLDGMFSLDLDMTSLRHLHTHTLSTPSPCLPSAPLHQLHNSCCLRTGTGTAFKFSAPTPTHTHTPLRNSPSMHRQNSNEQTLTFALYIHTNIYIYIYT